MEKEIKLNYIKQENKNQSEDMSIFTFESRNNYEKEIHGNKNHCCQVCLQNTERKKKVRGRWEKNDRTESFQVKEALRKTKKNRAKGRNHDKKNQQR